VAVDSLWQPAAARASLSIRRALEDIEPDRWIDDASLRDGETGPVISARRARSLTRRARARFYVTSTVEHSDAATDSARVSVTLNDLEQELDTTVVALGAASDLPDLALNAVVRLLPRLTGLERQIHPASLSGRAPAVVSNWLRGEHEYRSSRINSSLDYLRRALAADSSLAPAALRAAMASMWLDDEREASQLVGLAQRHRGMLSASQAAFAEALRLYLLGAADSAVVAVLHALEAGPAQAEPWMLTGEIYRHLMPAVPLDSQLVRVVPEEVTLALDSLAEYAHMRARAVDRGFSPPLAHLAEAAARRADVGALDSLLREFREAKADSAILARLTLVQRCLTRGVTPAEWSTVTRADARTVHGVGVFMSGASAMRARVCAENAWSALRNAEDASMRWAALVAQLGLHAAAGENATALALIDSVVASGMSAALGLYILGAAAGIDPGTRADAFVAQLDSAIASRPAPSLWLLTLWSARTADTTRLAKVRARLETLKSVNRMHLDTLVADVVDAYLALARRDTTAALKAFGALAPRAPRSVLDNSLWEPLATERLVYARLLLATGSPATAHRVASMFDQPGFYLNTLFLRPSLEIRVEAARVLGRESLRRAAEDRLRRMTPGVR
jgi:tetratricopeptide (TPR) repeat protein